MKKRLPFPHQTQVPLSDYSTFAIGGPARFFAKAATIKAMQEMLSVAYTQGIPCCVLGKGSNTLFDDKGFEGLVILNRISHLVQEEGYFTVGSGYSFPRLGKMTARLGWSGLEFAAGIPATVGGAIYMNAGAGGQETADRLKYVRYINERGEALVFESRQLNFGYRSSPFQEMKGAIVEGCFELQPQARAREEQAEHLNYRLKTQPYKERSAGCAFRNPIGHSAGALIDACGLKGLQRGGAAISNQHANFIVNRGGASAADVLGLIDEVKERVFREKGITLEEEIRRIAPF